MLKLDKNTKGINTDWIGYMGSIKNTKIKKSGKDIDFGIWWCGPGNLLWFLKKKYKNIIVFNRSRKAIKTSGANRFTKKYSLIDKHLKKRG